MLDRFRIALMAIGAATIAALLLGLAYLWHEHSQLIEQRQAATDHAQELAAEVVTLKAQRSDFKRQQEAADASVLRVQEERDRLAALHRGLGDRVAQWMRDHPAGAAIVPAVSGPTGAAAPAESATPVRGTPAATDVAHLCADAARDADAAVTEFNELLARWVAEKRAHDALIGHGATP